MHTVKHKIPCKKKTQSSSSLYWNCKHFWVWLSLPF